jgi:hypothetical protein
MKNLQQEKYKDDNGRDIEASKVEVLAPYKYHVDGFYQWTCPTCGFDHNSRSCGWPISGQVLACDQCHVKTLLVRTNCIEIDEVLQGKWRSEERDKENERLKGIEKYNADELQKIRFKILGIVEQAIASAKVTL